MNVARRGHCVTSIRLCCDTSASPGPGSGSESRLTPPLDRPMPVAPERFLTSQHVRRFPPRGHSFRGITVRPAVSQRLATVIGSTAFEDLQRGVHFADEELLLVPDEMPIGGR